ncbi:MAG: ribonuclease Y [Victivallaceae bacterium]|nr:ribonuclease Y [Victivallaceae bacterium]
MDNMEQIIIASIVSGAICIGITILLGKFRKDSASYSAERIKNDAAKEAEHIQREAKVSAKAELIKVKEDFEEEMKLRRQDQLNNEKRLSQRDENLERKADVLDSKMTNLERKEVELKNLQERVIGKENELQVKISEQIDELERIALLDRESAKKMLLEKLEGKVKTESGLLIRDILEEAKLKAEREAKRILSYAIQRYAADSTSNRTASTIPLPSDDMKGRIIGREGRNIRAIEAATGVNILIDDTPEAVVISCFDPVRKEIAHHLLERLIADGRIHPTRIEELVPKIADEIEEEIFEAGEAAVLETGIHGVAPQVVKLLGRLKFRYSFSQNVLKHSLECAFFMGMIASELGLDEQKAKRIGLLHDIGKAVDHDTEGSHAVIGADILKKHGESKDVINAVASHHGDVEANSIYAVLVNACDAISASRPGARSETTELYLKRLEQLEDIAHSFSGVVNCFALQAGREVRVVVEPGKINEGEAHVLARDICQRVEREMTYPGQIKVTIIRETRSVEYAK